MPDADARSPITLIQALALCFEKDEMLDGWAYRWCPLPSAEIAARTFDDWVAQLTLLKGAPDLSRLDDSKRAEWQDLRVKQAGRGIVFWIGAVEVYQLWEQPGIWDDSPIDAALDWGPGDRGYRPGGGPNSQGIPP